MNFNLFDQETRLLIEADLRPVQGERFQPTGFPELGSATYTLPDGTEMLLVESAQSIANRLEAVCWNDADQDLKPFLQGLPYIRVTSNGEVITNSILEAHRLNSPYILESQDKSFTERLLAELNVSKDSPVDFSHVAKVIFKYDPNSVIHGLFISRGEFAGGRLKLPRLLSGFIEARNVRPVESGGVKLDRVDPTANAQLGFGHVPYTRTEYTAEKITAYFNYDLGLLRSYRLGKEAENFFIAWGIWKILCLLDSGLRLRTACDLSCQELKVTQPSDFELPNIEDLEREMPKLINSVPAFDGVSVTDVNFIPPKKWKKKKAAKEVVTDEGVEDE
jgi:CRISPR-associated protein Csb1